MGSGVFILDVGVRISQSQTNFQNQPSPVLPQDSCRGLWGKLFLGTPETSIACGWPRPPNSQFSWPTLWLGFLLVIKNTLINLFQMPAVALL